MVVTTDALSYSPVAGTRCSRAPPSSGEEWPAAAASSFNDGEDGRGCEERLEGGGGRATTKRNETKRNEKETRASREKRKILSSEVVYTRRFFGDYGFSTIFAFRIRIRRFFPRLVSSRLHSSTCTRSLEPTYFFGCPLFPFSSPRLVIVQKLAIASPRLASRRPSTDSSSPVIFFFFAFFALTPRFVVRSRSFK